MKASLQWMNDYVPVDLQKNPQELADALTQAGIPVEEVTVLPVGAGIKKVLTGKITQIEQHPDADKLVVCQLLCKDDQTGEEVTKQIVTGATNVRVGQIVPVAYHKSQLPEKEIKKGKLRGVVSEGMLCSITELGIDKDLVLPEDADGIYILPADTPIGLDIKDVLGLNDVVYEFELTPNRADCFSMIGLSREFAVQLGKSNVLPKVEVQENGKSIEGQADIFIENEELCSRFTARLVKNVKIVPSPLWLQNRLRKAGIRPINNVVDVTNYVMVEWGQPMHAYDYDHVKGHSLTARLAKEGEVLKTLDGTDRVLTESMLIIADAERPVGVAGVMGGFDSEVTKETTNILFEAAVFDGASIRRTARALGMRSEASGRFERGVNPAFTHIALDRAVSLLAEIAEGVEIAADYIDVYPTPVEHKMITFVPEEVNRFLGTNISRKEMAKILTSLHFKFRIGGVKEVLGVVEDAILAKETKWTVRVPSWRQDVTDVCDIAEEVARIYNYDNIPSTTPVANLRNGVKSDKGVLQEKITSFLAEVGMTEVIAFSFMDDSDLTKLQLAEDDARRLAVPILNPISEEMPLMRTTLIPAMLQTAVRNFSQKNNDLWLFEEGAVYEPKALPLQDFVNERSMVSGLLVGSAAPSAAWPTNQRKTDFFDGKGILDALFVELGVAVSVARSEEAYLHPGASVTYFVDGTKVATYGELHPQVAKNFDMPEHTFIFEVDVDALLTVSMSPVKYEAISKFPGTSRDLAIVAPQTVASDEIVAVIKELGGEFLTNVYLFDVYEGQHIAKGYRSLAYNLAFRSMEGTLTTEDIEPRIEAIVAALSEKGCSLR